ncbi:AfsR/SARP family transcriptional regulator, partial [Streptomyces tendae]|uniref:AfsR/SARP family transcriptional regulator n=1 Tax=Streptomyces tendae TaxID=1932 RepID=UPI0036C71E66
MRYRILGTTQVLRPDGTAVPLGGARLRALLTVLALRAGRAVPTGLLVEEVWDGDPPADAPGALQALVGRLRRALGADSVASADGGYRLAAAPDDVDLHRFDRLAGEGTRALADGDPAKAAVVLDDALALWRDPVLPDLPDRTAETARWTTRRLDTLRARHTAALALGQAEHSLPELTALCDSHPLDEPLQALRLRALRDAGRTAEALAAYESVRRVLAARLGADPGPELRALHAELLCPAPTPEPGRAPGPGARSSSGAASSSGPAPGPAAPGSGPGPASRRWPASGAPQESAAAPPHGTAPAPDAAAASGGGAEPGTGAASGAWPASGTASASGAESAPGTESVPGTAPASGAVPAPGAAPAPDAAAASGGGAEPGTGAASGAWPASGTA